MAADAGTVDAAAPPGPRRGRRRAPAPSRRDGAARRRRPPDEPPPGELHTAVPQVLKILGTVVAPTTLLTALMLYFGNLHAQGLFRYLRVPFTVFELTPQDYLIRSADGLFVPLTIAAALAVVVCWCDRLVVGTASQRTRTTALRVLAPVTALAGAGLLVFAFLAVTRRDAPFPASFPEAGGLSLAAGVLLLAWAVRLVRNLALQRRPGAAARAPVGVLVEWGAIFVLVSVGLFWAVNSYALGVGRTRGQQIADQLGASPDVVLYAEKRLSVQLPDVREVPCADPDAAYRFRYEGLKLVMRSGDQYLFLPVGWTRESGTAVLVPRSEGLRLEFTGPGQALPAGSC